MVFPHSKRKPRQKLSDFIQKSPCWLMERRAIEGMNEQNHHALLVEIYISAVLNRDKMEVLKNWGRESPYRTVSLIDMYNKYEKCFIYGYVNTHVHSSTVHSNITWMALSQNIHKWKIHKVWIDLGRQENMNICSILFLVTCFNQENIMPFNWVKHWKIITPWQDFG